jgi:hypothetical protein
VSESVQVVVDAEVQATVGNADAANRLREWTLISEQ